MNRDPKELLARMTRGERVMVSGGELAEVRALEVPAASLVVVLGWMEGNPVAGIRPPSVGMAETLDRIKRNGGG